MWFAALGSYRENPWFTQLCTRLLQGTPSVVRLLESNPFPDRPPRYVRGALYRYEFTRSGTGAPGSTWWRREAIGVYSPVYSAAEIVPVFR